MLTAALAHAGAVGSSAARGRTTSEPVRLAPSSAPGHLVLHVGVDQVTPRGATSVEFGHVFAGGDRFRIRLSASRDGYVFLLVRGTDQELRRMWPTVGGAAPVTARETVLVPPDGNFRFDDGSSVETVRIGFALAPVADPLALRLDGAVEDRGGATRVRQIHLRGGVEGARADAEFTGDITEGGVAVVDVEFAHRARP